MSESESDFDQTGDNSNIKPMWLGTMNGILTGADVTIFNRVTAAIDKTISQRTAVKATSTMFGVTDVDQELKDIEADKDREMDRQEELAKITEAAKPAGTGQLGENKSKPVSKAKPKT